MHDPDQTRRELLRASLELVALAVLVDGPVHGYGLQRRLMELGGRKLPPGTLYPLLHRLEAQGLIEASWGPGRTRPRKHYRLTDTGRQRLRQGGGAWSAAIARLESVVLPAIRRVAGGGGA